MDSRRLDIKIVTLLLLRKRNLQSYEISYEMFLLL